MSIKMMPPKKSKAARSDNLDTNADEKPVEAAPERALPAAESDEEPITGVPPKKKAFNMFDVTTIEGKRKRVVAFNPEAALNVWIDEYFEEKADVKLNLGEVYNIYLAKCVNEASNALEDNFFNKVMRQKFPNGFSLKPNSPFGDRLKEKKVKKKEPKVKADTLSIKIRDIIENTLKELGNPRGGVRFGKLVTHVAGKYPALRIEMRPKMLLTALQRGVRYGYLTCDRGIGKCGYYRLYVENEPDEPEKDEKDDKKNDKKKDDKKKDDKEKDGDEKDEEKSADESADESKEKEIKAEDGKEESTEKEDDKGAAKKKTKKKVPKERFIHHGDPSRVEDTFYLAMTFMSEPKEASVIRIKKYIAEHYADANVDRVARCLDTGKERGYWEQTSGSSGSGGKFRLEVDSFDPTDDEDMTGMVINAIMACTEPKMCSANLLKKYVVEWYAEKFKVADRPHLFRKAIDRALANQEIKQLSGIGASGTFQLAKPFFPSPAILAGQDTPSDYEQESEDTSDEEAVESYDFSGYGDKYKPRPSKRRGMARSKAVHAKPAVEVKEEPGTKRKQKVARKVAQKSRKRSRRDSSSEESSDKSSNESESEEEAPPPQKRGAPKKREAPAAKKRNASPAKKTPAKKTPAKKTPAKKADKKAAPDSKGRSRASMSYAESSDEEGDDSDVEKVVDGYKPTPSKSRGGAGARTPVTPTPKKKTPKKKTPAKKPKKEPEPEPEPETPSRRVRTPAAKKQGDDIRYDSDSADSIDSEPRAPRVETPAAKKQRSATAPKSRGRRK